VPEGVEALPRLKHPDWVTAVAFSPDGNALLTACHDAAVRQWDLHNGRLIGATLQHERRVDAAAYSLDGRIIATGCKDGFARYWDATSGRLLAPPLKHNGEVLAVAVSRVGAATASIDGVARMWRLPAPIDSSREYLSAWIELLTGVRIDVSSGDSYLDGAAWRQKFNRLQSLHNQTP
jgi:WD40 repeat protein